MAVAYLALVAPECHLWHIHDSALPAIGVGEGTTPPFVRWCGDSFGWGLDELSVRCLATHKDGIRFEGWGSAREEYVHYFSPRLEGPAFHISADRLIESLGERGEATRMDLHVRELRDEGGGVTIAFDGAEALSVDLVLDARGFPADLTAEHVRLDCVPTNAAAVRRGPTARFQTATRAVARPHGWIFVIPLTEYTSYGYVHNSEITPGDDLEADFDVFLASEGVETASASRLIPFPNFVHRRFVDGGVFRIGNAAAFAEPIEATALALILYELELVSHHAFGRTLELSRRPMEDRAPARLNEHLIDFVREIELFIGWHYAHGSRFDTPFWDHARAAWDQGLARLRVEAPDAVERFERQLALGAAYPVGLAGAADPEDMDRLEGQGPPAVGDFGGFLTPSFGKVGQGIGAFDGIRAPGREDADSGPGPAIPPITIAHRGASGHAPEHTMRAYEIALEMGADYIEQDLQMTRDGVLVVIHDDTLDRTAGGVGCSGAVRDLTRAELATCDAGRWFNDARPDRSHPDNVGLGIPTLREVFERFGRGARYYIETKSPDEAPGMEEALVGELERAGLLPDSSDDRTVYIQSFSAASLRRVAELAPDLPLIQLLDESMPATDDRLGVIAEYAVGIGPNRQQADRDLVDRAAAHGLVVHPWTVNEEAEMRRLIDAGVDGLFTDYPDRFGRVKREAPDRPEGGAR